MWLLLLLNCPLSRKVSRRAPYVVPSSSQIKIYICSQKGEATKEHFTARLVNSCKFLSECSILPLKRYWSQKWKKILHPPICWLLIFFVGCCHFRMQVGPKQQGGKCQDDVRFSSQWNVSTLENTHVRTHTRTLHMSDRRGGFMLPPREWSRVMCLTVSL